MIDYGREIAKAGLEIKAIKLNPDNPFQWASGYRMPIYNDNRMFLFFPEDRKLITDGLESIAKKLPFSVVAGTSTSGIAPGVLLSEKCKCPFIYIRDKPKDHGLRNRIEGIDAEDDLSGHVVILVEDLISTGGSSANAVRGIRDAKGRCDNCLSLFDYGLDKAIQEFSVLDPICNVRSLLTYDVLLDVAKEIGYLTKEQIRVLGEWRADPFNWGEKHGFPKVEKGEKK